MRVLALLAAALFLGACAPRSAITGWPWSDWYRVGGGGEMGSFEHQRQACLEQHGVSDPSAVTADSAAETDYIVCMNGSGWCTTAFGCQKPGAS